MSPLLLNPSLPLNERPHASEHLRQRRGALLRPTAPLPELAALSPQVLCQHRKGTAGNRSRLATSMLQWYIQSLYNQPDAKGHGMLRRCSGRLAKGLPATPFWTFCFPSSRRSRRPLFGDSGLAPVAHLPTSDPLRQWLHSCPATMRWTSMLYFKWKCMAFSLPAAPNGSFQQHLAFHLTIQSRMTRRNAYIDTPKYSRSFLGVSGTGAMECRRAVWAAHIGGDAIECEEMPHNAI